MLISVTISLTLRFTLILQKNKLFVTTNGENEKATLQIINNNGMKMIEILTTLNPSTFIDIYTLPKGIYNLQISTKTCTQVIKFVKEQVRNLDISITAICQCLGHFFTEVTFIDLLFKLTFKHIKSFINIFAKINYEVYI